MLALEYGADLVYSEELVAQSLAATTRFFYTRYRTRLYPVAIVRKPGERTRVPGD